VTLLGCIPTLVNALGTNYNANGAAGVTGSGTTPSAVEFGMYGSDFDIIFRNAVGSGSWFWVWATDPDTGALRPQTAAPVVSTANAANSLHYYRATFGSAAERVVRVYCDKADFGGIDAPQTSTIFAVPRPMRSLCIIGDSYTAGTGATSAIQSWGVTLGRLLDAETFINAVGGTGYTAANAGAGGNNKFGDTPRLNAAIATGATDFLIAGSINDSAATPAAVTAAAQSLIGSIAAALPSARFWMSGVQMLPVGYNTGNNVANNAALKTLAQSLGIPFIDEIGEGWYSGTGYAGAAAGNGNRDLLCGSDQIHPTQAGHDNKAARTYTRLMQLGF
jgi:lysophospholipase L1-like esterase